MIKKIENMKFLEDVKNAIKNYGVFIFGISDVIPCELCQNKDPNHTHVKEEDDPDLLHIADAFNYTIGHKERDRPDIIVFCGTKPEEIPFTPEELKRRIYETGSLINYLVRNWDKKPVEINHTCEDSDGRVYRVVDHIKYGYHTLKENNAVQASNYYGSYDYELLVLMPIGWSQQLQHKRLH